MTKSRGDTRSAGDADIAWCHRSVQGVSRTFALTVEVLEEPMASYICVGYLLCRVPDTVEDAEHLDAADKVRLLRLYDAALDPDDPTDAAEFTAAVEPHLPAERDDDWDVVAETPRVFNAFDSFDADVRRAIRSPARELVQGMAMFVDRYAEAEGLRIGTREELDEYCYYAAGTVGNLVTNLVTRGDVDAEREHRLYNTAEEFGLLLQLVNIAKDVHHDYTAENNVYLPAEWLEEEGVPQDEVTDPRHQSGVASVVRRTITHATSFLDDAQRYLELVPTTDGNTLAAWAVPFLLAVGTLRELRDDPHAAVTGAGVKVSRQEVFAVMSAMNGGDKRTALGDLRQTISSQPFHRTTAD
jgi:farnesyl-diphosphate farnesyltransferase